ncbi:tRNA(Ile)-lysidine synthase [Asaia siamensis]|uniref:tRNA(Ile)-lysidine synthase n=2 Tax=Asaia siamensis TaxID=110479 RepID=A0ABQ1LBP5_9PROT|nr:Ile-tRNA lysidine synthase TilS [Asaia siamensis NRIC 0323]GGC21767.1 tRNA(Ile)-lysidine synthase [Asaia siamensis]
MRKAHPVGESEFASLMSVFGPFLPDEARFPIGIAVSGGADSLCLAWLMRRWRYAVLALVVDHGLRDNSAAEAAETASRLQALDIPSVILRLDSVIRTGSLQKNARIARYEALEAACHSRGILDLALGHHERDQVETFLLREAHGSSTHGLAAMAFARETPQLRYLRPLLEIAPERLRATLRQQGIQWVEDPSNRNPVFERVRIRLSLDESGHRAARAQLALHAGQRNEAALVNVAALSKLHADPLGFVVMDSLPGDPALLGRIWQSVSGAAYPPSPQALAALIAAPRPATLAGAQLCAAGRLGKTWLLVREPAAIARRIAAQSGVTWDGRFTLRGMVPEPGTEIAALGAEARHFRDHALPAKILSGLPALWIGTRLMAVPQLGAFAAPHWARLRFSFSPATPLSDPSFWPEYRETVKT